MATHKLIQDAASYSPEQLKALGKAFDDAWKQLAPTVSKRAEAIESARLKLANAILGAAKVLPTGTGEQIKDEALRMKP